MALRNFLKPWQLVALGILLNIVSALMIYVVVERNMHGIDRLSQQIHRVELQVDSNWQTYLRLERQQEFLLGLLLTATAGEPRTQVQGFVGQELARLAEKHKVERDAVGAASVTIEGVQSLVGEIQRQLLDTVDDVYLEKIETERLKHTRERANERWRSIALFLQLIGLILVLARDLARSV